MSENLSWLDERPICHFAEEVQLPLVTCILCRSDGLQRVQLDDLQKLTSYHCRSKRNHWRLDAPKCTKMAETNQVRLSFMADLKLSCQSTLSCNRFEE